MKTDSDYLAEKRAAEQEDPQIAEIPDDEWCIRARRLELIERLYCQVEAETQ